MEDNMLRHTVDHLSTFYGIPTDAVDTYCANLITMRIVETVEDALRSVSYVMLGAAEGWSDAEIDDLMTYQGRHRADS
jgi:hypothetical protein